MQEHIQKMKEEEERRKIEEEERIKKEEELERLRIEEEEKQEKIKQDKKQQKKIKEKQKAQQAKQNAQLQKYAQVRQQLGTMPGITIPAVSADRQEESQPQPLSQSQESKPKKVIYGKPKKKKIGQDLDETKDESQPEQQDVPEQKEPEEVNPVERNQEEPQILKEQATTDWENWEEADVTLEKKPIKPVKPVEKPVKAVIHIPAEKAPQPKVNQPQEMEKEQTENATTEGKEVSEEPELRSPICCILGHVDTGKTKLLDKIRQTNVQEGEAGGITQQIGATYFPLDAIREKTSKLSEDFKNMQFKVPGLLVIDTPGHASFNNLRSRGSSLCDIAILVVDIMHGIEPQTEESINLLKMRKTPFIIALNKVDRIYGWKAIPNAPIQQSLKKQDKTVIMEYDKLVSETMAYFAERSFNTSPYYKIKSLQDFRKTVSIVPTSAITGEGIPDLLVLLCQLTQKLMSDRLLYSPKLQCTVLEVKVVEGLGTTIDVILVNGTLNEGDQIVVCGLNGPIVTNIRAILTPKPMKEIRVKGSYDHHKAIKAAQGIKLCAAELDKAVAGSSLFVIHPDSNVEELKAEVMKDLESLLSKVDKSGIGVYVQASTLGSLEALLEFLKTSNIPASGINIGPVNKKDVMKASTMLERAKQYAVILAFDVKVTKEAREVAEEMGVRIFTADIIYHLFDQFTVYIDRITNDEKVENSADAVFPCRLKIYPEHIFNKRDPIVIGVEVIEGVLKIGTPIIVPSKDMVELGRITSIENNHKSVEEARKGSSVAIKIEDEIDKSKAFGRHFDHNDELISKITRHSLDVLKKFFSKDVTKEDTQLLAKLKNGPCKKFFPDG